MLRPQKEAPPKCLHCWGSCHAVTEVVFFTIKTTKTFTIITKVINV